MNAESPFYRSLLLPYADFIPPWNAEGNMGDRPKPHAFANGPIALFWVTLLFWMLWKPAAANGYTITTSPQTPTINHYDVTVAPSDQPFDDLELQIDPGDALGNYLIGNVPAGWPSKPPSIVQRGGNSYYHLEGPALTASPQSYLFDIHYNGANGPNPVEGTLTKGGVPIYSQCVTGWASKALCTIPSAVTLEAAGAIDGQFGLHVIGPPGVQVKIEASTNLLDWMQLLVAVPFNGGFDFVDTNSVVIPYRFYRSSVVLSASTDHYTGSSLVLMDYVPSEYGPGATVSFDLTGSGVPQQTTKADSTGLYTIGLDTSTLLDQATISMVFRSADGSKTSPVISLDLVRDGPATPASALPINLVSGRLPPASPSPAQGIGANLIRYKTDQCN